ncbi:hypothetical protein K431DRAFT_285589 [Polychaeton citri CBS 116435]|uniref:Zn(2)-C6 fungal-type domain-containing protein n=1 Tax=Polychaeton citri CBS 116435 TaxID=1314669 RepID=A0A9P4Q6X5_9PEZI|nr:hypothetical protein K431DRAFT_285589 [Polychaeton citri CBS 116435]
MPRPKKDNGAEPKRRSRTGCWPCKARKVKCGEEKPGCANCLKTGETCDYSIRLNWSGRSGGKRDSHAIDGAFTFVASPGGNSTTSAGSPDKSPANHGHEHVFSAQHIATKPSRPAPTSRPEHNLPTPDTTPSAAMGSLIDPGLPNYRQQANTSFSSLQQRPDLSPPTSAPAFDSVAWSPRQGNKRVRLSPKDSPVASNSSPSFAIPQFPPNYHLPPMGANSPASTTASFHSHGRTSTANLPGTPNSSNTPGSPYLSRPFSFSGLQSTQDAPDLRRLSVKSLLTDSTEDTKRHSHRRADSMSHRTYGYDHGLIDVDIPMNDDFRVIQPKSPDLRKTSVAMSQVSTSSDEQDSRQMAFEPGGYYAQPVPVRIPRFLEPLPQELLSNPMNLLYFHHFINHTGRIMVPHDCPQNPFRGVLAQMAVRNRHLLHLLLAFSASHRARLLGHDEPANRIAEWMDDVLPALRQALSGPSSPGKPADPADPSNLAPLATAIMLASLEIISPNTFAVPITWQDHLKVARQLIVVKGGLHHLAHDKSSGARDKAIFFLSRWFAYLDVFGSLSGSQKAELPLFDSYHEDGGGQWLVNRADDEIYQIDCFFGFSGRCIALLAGVAEMSAECDRQRIDPITNQIKVGWRPDEHVRQRAEALRRRLEASAHNVYRGCMHVDDDPAIEREGEGVSVEDVEETYAVNEAYHWAGLIHLMRRVLNVPSEHPDVQQQVRNVLNSLLKIRRGSSAEGCLLFPMFSAGCECLRESEREVFRDRLRVVEGWGMHQVRRARELMQEVWDTGRPWETLVQGEFFG